MTITLPQNPTFNDAVSRRAAEIEQGSAKYRAGQRVKVRVSKDVTSNGTVIDASGLRSDHRSYVLVDVDGVIGKWTPERLTVVKEKV